MEAVQWLTGDLFGGLEIEGNGDYYLFLSQRKNFKTWVITTRDIFEVNGIGTDDKIVAALKSYAIGKLEGYGKTYILTKLISVFSSLVYVVVNNKLITREYGRSTAEYSNGSGDNLTYFSFEVDRTGTIYHSIELVSEGFKFSLSVFTRKFPFTLKKMYPVADEMSKVVLVSNLGLKTAASLFKFMGDRLNWYKSKNYKLIDTKESFRAMMLEFLRDVQRAHDRNLSVLVGLDTETTGLNMLNLKPTNPLKDRVVAIPFAWREADSYLICTDMYYFSNVDSEEIYPLFTKLFSRNRDFTFQDIKLEYEGEKFSFNRQNITVAGWNVMFDEQAFLTENCDVFFDEDGRQLYFNLDTDLKQGELGYKEMGTYRISNSLKSQTRRMIGDETLELSELFGPKNEDKFRYLQDDELAKLYGCADADYTRKCVKLAKKMTEPNLYKQYRKYDMTIMYKLAHAAWNGMHIDTESVKKLGELVKQDLERLKEFIYRYAWLANRDTLKDKSDELCKILGVDLDVDLNKYVEDNKLFKYPFTPANHKKLLFNILGYPVLRRSEKSGEPSLDKTVLKKLKAFKREKPVEILKEDLMSLYDPETKLVDKKDFNKELYPLARVFSTYATLFKEYSSYYKPLLEHDTEDRMFYGFTMARAATRRILSPGQTMKGSLKSLVTAPAGQLYMAFDASQIEYRHMASLAYIKTKKDLQEQFPNDWKSRLEQTAIYRTYTMMQKAEADYHIETAAALTGLKQHQVDSTTRKSYKCIGFGIPYGLGLRSLCENLHGEITEDNLRHTQELLDTYKKNQKEIIDLLESTRDTAFVPATISDEHRKYLRVGDSHVGIVRNFTGFYRLFILENLTRAATGSIRRKAGNCIIQGGAAELYRRMLYNFHQGCCKCGIDKKVHWVMTVHDELDTTINNDIDVMLLIKTLHENCTLIYKDHIPYYIGIGFGSSWGEAKSDANELPVIMVERMIKAYDAGKFFIPCDGNQDKNLLLLKRHYLCDRIDEELSKIVPTTKGHIWTDEEVVLVDEKFENYIVRAYLVVFSSKDTPLKEQLQAWQKAREEYGIGNGFLSTKFESSDDSIDFDIDLTIDLLDNSDDKPKEDTVWFDENSLFDTSVNANDIVVEDDNYTDVALDIIDKSSEDDLVINENPENAFDVYVSKTYKRTRVLKVDDNSYSVMLTGTPYFQDIKGLAKDIKKHFVSGEGSILLIGNTILKVPKLFCRNEDLDWLDKKLNAS